MKKIVIAILIVASVVGVVFYSTSGGDFQGRFFQMDRAKNTGRDAEREKPVEEKPSIPEAAPAPMEEEKPSIPESTPAPAPEEEPFTPEATPVPTPAPAPSPAGFEACPKPMTRCELLKTINYYGFMVAPYTPEAATFADVPFGHECNLVVESAAHSNILNGYEDGTFKPDNSITRAETAKTVYLVAGDLASKGNGDGTDPFLDVLLDDGEWYYDYVAALANVGAINFRDNNKYFYPNELTYRDWLIGVLKALNVKKYCSMNEADDYVAQEKPIGGSVAGTLTLSTVPSSSTSLTNGYQNVYTFSATAEGEDIKLDTLKFKYLVSSPDGTPFNVSDVKLNLNISSGNYVAASADVDGVVTFSGLNTVIEKAKTKNFILRLNATGVQKNDALTIELTEANATGMNSSASIPLDPQLTPVTLTTN